MIRKKGLLTYLSSRHLEAEDGITHSFLTRKGGKSTFPFASLNLSTAEGDKRDNVLYHKRLIGDTFGFSPSSLITIEQVHGKDVVVIDDMVERHLSSLNLKGDSIITNRTGLVLGVLTADCLPVLFFEPLSRVIGIVHTGWRGTALRIVQETILKMEETFGIKRDKLRVILGPSIGPCCYEIKGNVLSTMKRELNEDLSLVGGKRLDLVETNLKLLIKMGIRDDLIDYINLCTSCRKELFFSYRRDGMTGRQLSFIRLD